LKLDKFKKIRQSILNERFQMRNFILYSLVLTAFATTAFSFDSGRATYDRAIRTISENCVSCEGADSGRLDNEIKHLQRLVGKGLGDETANLALAYAYWTLSLTRYDSHSLESQLFKEKSLRYLSKLLVSEIDFISIQEQLTTNLGVMGDIDSVSITAFKTELRNFVEVGLIDLARSLIVEECNLDSGFAALQSFWRTVRPKNRHIFSDTMAGLLTNFDESEEVNKLKAEVEQVRAQKS